MRKDGNRGNNLLIKTNSLVDQRRSEGIYNKNREELVMLKAPGF